MTMVKAKMCVYLRLYCSTSLSVIENRLNNKDACHSSAKVKKHDFKEYKK